MKLMQTCASLCAKKPVTLSPALPNTSIAIIYKCRICAFLSISLHVICFEANIKCVFHNAIKVSLGHAQGFLRGEALLPFPLVGCGGAELNILSGSTSKMVEPINLGNPIAGCNHLAWMG